MDYLSKTRVKGILTHKAHDHCAPDVVPYNLRGPPTDEPPQCTPVS